MPTVNRLSDKDIKDILDKLNKTILKKSKMIYSKQALTYLEVISEKIEFDVKDFESWYLKNNVIGGGDIMMYLKQKKDGSR